MRPRRSAALFAGMTALLAAAEARAAGRGAFIRDGEYWGFEYGAFEQGLAAGGASPVERAPALPADLSPYNLVIVVLPKTAPDPDEASALVDFVAGGGALVLVSDYDGYAPEPSGLFNALLPELGVDARFAHGTVYGCSSAATTNPHPLTAGLDVFHSTAPDFVTPGPATQVIVETPEGEPILAVERNVVLLSDSNAINTAICSPETVNVPFFANLPAFACDIDGDGVGNGSCDGDDPDDLDPTITEPGGASSSGTGDGSTGGESGDGSTGATSGADPTGGGTTDDDGTTGAASSGPGGTSGDPGGATGSTPDGDASGCGCRGDSSAGALALLVLAAGRRRRFGA
jgi:hypothetical protein